MRLLRRRKIQEPLGLNQKGLTLLEVVVTLILLSMMAIIAAKAFRLGRRVWESQERKVEAEHRIRVIYGTLAQEMVSIRPVTELVDGKRVAVFEGWEDRILFYGRPDRYQPFPYNVMVRSLSFSVDRERGLVMHESFPLVTDESLRSRTRIVDPKVTRIEFRYLLPSAEDLRELNWVGRWKPIEFVRSLGKKTRKITAGQRIDGGRPSGEGIGLPQAIDVTVTISEAQEENEFTFLVPIHIGEYL